MTNYVRTTSVSSGGREYGQVWVRGNSPAEREAVIKRVARAVSNSGQSDTDSEVGRNFALSGHGFGGDPQSDHRRSPTTSPRPTQNPRRNTNPNRRPSNAR